jgi:1-pyrroline-5-carboxylate dehydrogenase
MTVATVRVPPPGNEPVRDYAPGTAHRAALQAALAHQAARVDELPAVIAGERVTTARRHPVVMPHAHAHVLGHAHLCGEAEVARAIAAARAARAPWGALPLADRVAVFLRAADMLAGPWRDRINAATMLGQSKTAHQAEIDAACELIDFLRWNCAFLLALAQEQPVSPPGTWNRVELRPLDGFVLAVTPFNFTAIAGNLPTSAALCGNTVLWKPSTTQMLAAAATMELLEAAGLPPGVINLLPGDGADVGEPALRSPELAGLHFTGSTATFHGLWRTIGQHIDRYAQYPRIVGETGGKDFIVAHPSADLDALVVAIVRGAFEYQGQKCSAASRVYVPASLWPQVREGLVAALATITTGDVRDLRHFMGAVIDARAYARHAAAITAAKAAAASGEGRVLEVLGGEHDDRDGWFVQPTVIVAADPRYPTMVEELFGPIVTIHPYDDAVPEAWERTLALCDATSPYGLTGAVFARDRGAIARASELLRHAAGNFYVNDKPTGAVVGQQPFGGGRASGTNDKAGSPWNLLRWLSPRAIKETFVPPTAWPYPHMRE